MAHFNKKYIYTEIRLKPVHCVEHSANELFEQWTLDIGLYKLILSMSGPYYC